MSVSSCSQYHTNVDWPTARMHLAGHIEALTTTWRTYVVATGSQMMNQFVPCYFGVAFAFCFKYCIGMPDMPDFAKNVRHRRKGYAPRIELPLWVRTISRRVEKRSSNEIGCSASQCPASFSKAL